MHEGVGSKRIVCLANSRKMTGRCIAGRELVPGSEEGWIQPVSEREYQEVPEDKLRYEDGSDPQVLDIIDIPVRGPQPDGHQTENWLLDPEHNWKKVGVHAPFDLPDLADPVEPLWVDGYSTQIGNNDRIPIEAIGEATSSLRLIRVEEVVLKVHASRRVQGQFVHADQDYAFWVTDPIYEGQYRSKPDGTYPIGECHLTISLGEPYKGFIYKLIAAIIEPGGR